MRTDGDLEHAHILVAQFAERATPLGTNVERAASNRAAASRIASLAELAGTDRVIASSQLAERAPTLVAAVKRARVKVDIAQGRDDARDRPLALSLAVNAIAETGSVLLDERQLTDRAPGLMSLHSIVVVSVDDIVPSLDSTPALLREIASRPGGGYATFMTGPSRTADIEMSLTVGVQGPGAVTILFVDRLG